LLLFVIVYMQLFVCVQPISSCNWKSGMGKNNLSFNWKLSEPWPRVCSG